MEMESETTDKTWNDVAARLTSFDENAEIALPIQKLSKEEVEKIEIFNGIPLEGDRTDVILPTTKIEYNEDISYYLIPLGYTPYSIDDSYSFPGMCGVCITNNGYEIAEVRGYELTTNTPVSMDGAVAVYNSYYSALTKRNDILKNGGEISEEDQKIIDFADKIDEIAKEVYYANIEQPKR